MLAFSLNKLILTYDHNSTSTIECLFTEFHLKTISALLICKNSKRSKSFTTLVVKRAKSELNLF